MQQTPAQQKGIASVADALAKTLRQESEALSALSRQFNAQLDALREQELEVIEEATIEANELIARMNRLRQTQEGQVRLLGRVLGADPDESSMQELAGRLSEHSGAGQAGDDLLAAYEAVREAAQAANRHCEELEFALQYAVTLGREMLSTLQDLDVPPPASVYTKTGSTTRPSSETSFLNEVG